MVILEKAQVIAVNNKKVISSAKREFVLPSVIRLNNYISRPFKKVILTRKNILRRDGYKCAYCGRSDLPLTIDHVRPKSRGGEDDWTNLITACLPCNNKKGDRTPEEANMILRIRPFKPSFITFIVNNYNRVNEHWKPYLFMK